jgi:hypothetical protein
MTKGSGGIHAALHGDRPSFGLKMQDLGQLVHEPALYQIFSVVTLQPSASIPPLSIHSPCLFNEFSVYP